MLKRLHDEQGGGVVLIKNARPITRSLAFAELGETHRVAGAALRLNSDIRTPIHRAVGKSDLKGNEAVWSVYDEGESVVGVISIG